MKLFALKNSIGLAVVLIVALVGILARHPQMRSARDIVESFGVVNGVSYQKLYIDEHGYPSVEDIHEVGSLSGPRRHEITDSDVEALQYARNLKKVWLNESQVTAAGIKPLQSCSSLRSIVLNGTHVGDEVAEPLLLLWSVSEIYLANTQVSDRTLDLLENHKKITLIDVRGTNVSAEGLASFRRNRPDVQCLAESSP